MKRLTPFSSLFEEGTSRADRWALPALLLAVSLFCAPLFLHPTWSTAEVDWNQLASVQLVLKKTLLHYGQLPLWTPYFGGGYPLWAYPENDLLNPFFLALLPCNLWLALKVRVWIYYLIGASGMYLLGRKGFRFSPAGAFFSAALFSFQSYLPYHTATGNLYIGSYYYLPWLLYLLIKTPAAKKYLILSSLLLAHLLSGATGLWVPCLLLFLFLWSLLEAVRARPRFAYLKNLLLITVIALLLSAVRLLPLGELLRHNERAFSDYSEAARGSLSPSGLVASLIRPGPFLPTEGDGLSRDEPLSDSTIYFGPAALFLIILALIFRFRKFALLLPLLVVFSLLAMGDGSPLDLFRLLWRLPVFRSIHFPNKYFSPFIAFILSLIAGGFFPLHRRQAASRLLSTLSLLVGLGIVAHLFLVDGRYHRGLFDRPPPALSPSRSFFPALTFLDPSPLPESLREGSIPLYRPGDFDHPYGAFRRLKLDRGKGPEESVVLLQRYNAEQSALAAENIGSIYWYGGLYLPEMASPKYFIGLGWIDLNTIPAHCYPQERVYYPNPAYRGEAYLESSRRPVGIKEFTPTSLLLSVEALRGDTLVVNQNYYPGWRSTAGEVFAHGGLLAVRLDRPGSYPVRFSYLPATFFLGLTVSVLTALGIFIWAVKKK